ncbi:MAG TPA: M20/M25/M40 family metallo-hydrolase [Bacteroidia bacterium]|jgi:carboxypeptidase PM20D1|nr:M20/M25/M40 family metallo-hydrolase [Bacteroidia bacterium]
MRKHLPFLLFFLFLTPACLGALPKDSLSQDRKILDLLSQLIRIRSVSGSERPALELLYTTSKEMGFHTHRFCDKDSFLNFSASVYPLESGKPNIILLCHLDVVPAPDSQYWAHPPFSGTLTNDTLWGRGCLDMKGIGVMELFAMQSWLDSARKRELPDNITLLFLSDEEKGSEHGARYVTDNYLSLLHPKLALGEGGAGFKNFLPSRPDKMVFFISVAEKKSLWLRLSVRHSGSGHGAMASEETANSILIRAISRVEDKKPIILFDKTTRHMFRELGKLNGGFKGFLLRSLPRFWMYPLRRKILRHEPTLLNEVINTVQLTNIYNAPAAPNVIPNEANAYFDCRLLPDVNTKKFIRKLRLRILNPKVKIEILDQSPTAPASAQGESFDAITRALLLTYPGSSAIPVLFPATTDNSFMRAVDIPSYGILPLELNLGLIETVHGFNECIPVKNIFEGIRAYRNILLQLMK